MTKEKAREYRKSRMRTKRFRRGGFPVMNGERVCASLRVKANGKREVKLFPEQKPVRKRAAENDAENERKFWEVVERNFREEDIEMAFEK